MGSALLTRREAWQKVGLLDERFFLYFEDVDWSKRFWENGYKVAYLPGAIMYHYLQRRSRAGLGLLDFFLRREARWHLQSALKYFIKHGLSYHSGPEIFSNVR
jgi:GT2 family glycosyltransferase